MHNLRISIHRAKTCPYCSCFYIVQENKLNASRKVKNRPAMSYYVDFDGNSINISPNQLQHSCLRHLAAIKKHFIFNGFVFLFNKIINNRINF